MKVSHVLLGLYVLIGLFVAVYGAFFGDQSFRGLPWHLGRGLIWPAVVFPGLGKAVGGTLLVLVILALLGLKK